MTFRIWQKVSCIHDKGQTVAPFVKCGDVYTISSMHERFIGTCLEFAELDTSGAPAQACFPAKYFRPIVEKNADISFAHEILRKATKRQDA